MAEEEGEVGVGGGPFGCCEEEEGKGAGEQGGRKEMEEKRG